MFMLKTGSHSKVMCPGFHLEKGVLGFSYSLTVEKVVEIQNFSSKLSQAAAQSTKFPNEHQ